MRLQPVGGGCQRKGIAHGRDCPQPVTTTANGLACLAELAPGAALSRARDEWARRGGGEAEEDFEKRLAEIRESGLAFDLDQHTLGISAVGAAFRDWSGSLYSISLPIPTPRFDEVSEEVKSALLHARKAAQALMRQD